MCNKHTTVCVLLLASFAHAAEPDCSSLGDSNKVQINGPKSAADRDAWFKKMKACRAAILESINYNSSFYDLQRLKWTQSAFAIPMVQSYDRFLYNGSAYTVEKYLDDVTKRYGGVDSLFLWPTYENIGLDDRNQVELFEAMPGGLAAVRSITEQFQEKGVTVMWGYNPWDTGTHRYAPVNESWAPPPATDDAVELIAALTATNADGINGDTMSFVPQKWFNVSLAAGAVLAFQPEGGGSNPSMNWETMSVCHCNYEKYTQTVDHYKWFEPRRMTSVRDRWSQDHTDSLHMAFFNGVGFETSENEWGNFYQFSPYNAEAIKRIFFLMRFFSATGTKHLISPDWEPHFPGTVNPAVFASSFPGVGAGENLFLLVNRGYSNYTGKQMELELEASVHQHLERQWRHGKFLGSAGAGASQLYDCWHGAPIVPGSSIGNDDRSGSSSTYTVVEGGKVTISFPFDQRGYGCILVTANSTASGTPLGNFLAQMKAFSATGALSTFDANFRFLQYSMVRNPRTNTSASAASTVAMGPGIPSLSIATASELDAKAKKTPAARPAGMVAIPAAAAFDFTVAGVEDQTVDVQYYWEINPTRTHGVSMPISAFYMDKTPVTAGQYGQYLKESGYMPEDTHNFLKNWNLTSGSFSGSPPVCPAVLTNKPVTHVSLNEARLYCKFYKKRLPQEWEWQYAAQGLDQRPYPWGKKCASGKKCQPDPFVGNTVPLPDDVGSYSPQGDSPFGVSDMLGTVWQYTSEFIDLHTRGNMLRGGSYYQAGIDGAKGSHWYFPKVTTVAQHNNYRLMSDSYERAGTLGFRCAQDQDTDAAAHNDDLTVTSEGGAVRSRWSGPPLAFSMLTTSRAPVPVTDPRPDVMRGVSFVDASTSTTASTAFPITEFARWSAENGTIHTVRSSGGKAAIGYLACGVSGIAEAAKSGVAAFSWEGASAPDAPVANATRDAVNCGAAGFELNVSVARTGLQTLTLYGGGLSLKVVAKLVDTVEGTAVGSNTVTQVVKPRVLGGDTPDTTHHISFDGVAGAVLNVLWLANSSHIGSNSSHAKFTYTAYEVNCFDGHGAVEIDSKPVANLTLAQCTARCNADEKCSCVQYTKEGVGKNEPGSCWKRAQCIPDKCLKRKEGDQTAYVKDYFVYNNTNCMDHEGAGRCLPEPCSSHTPNMTLHTCTEHCEADPDCGAAVFSHSRGWCWKRGDVNVAGFKRGYSDFITLVRPTVTGGEGAGQPLLYAATLSDGPMPPLPGY